jgi:hypothetical protein
VTRGKDDDRGDALAAAVARLLVPLVRILLRYGVTYGAFADLAKRVYVKVAEQDFQLAGRKQSASRVSVLTGLRRKEVATLRAEAAPPTIAGEKHSRVARLIAGWRHDERFLDAKGQPASLAFDEGKNSFSDLVRRYGSDVPARATLDELLRMGAVTRLRNERLKLVAQSYVPAALEVDRFGILGADVADLVAAIDHNLTCKRKDAFLQRKVAYDNLPQEALEKLRAAIVSEAEKLIEHADGSLSKHDRDIHPNVQGTGRKRAVLGVWYYEHDHAEDEDEEPKE